MGKQDIIERLRKDLLALQGFRGLPSETGIDLGPVNQAFPQAVFPCGAVHEFVCDGNEEMAAAGGFIAAITSALMKKQGIVFWISCGPAVFAPALAGFGIEPHRVVFVDSLRPADALWAMEEALKCEGLPAAICELPKLDFTSSRRFQLAVEQSHVTAFVLRPLSLRESANACLTRWRIRPVSSELEEDMPGVGFPRWQVNLLKVRNGKPGSWLLEWSAGKFNAVGLKSKVLESGKAGEPEESQPAAAAPLLRAQENRKTG